MFRMTGVTPSAGRHRKRARSGSICAATAASPTAGRDPAALSLRPASADPDRGRPQYADISGIARSAAGPGLARLRADLSQRAACPTADDRRQCAPDPVGAIRLPRYRFCRQADRSPPRRPRDAADGRDHPRALPRRHGRAAPVDAGPHRTRNRSTSATSITLLPPDTASKSTLPAATFRAAPATPTAVTRYWRTTPTPTSAWPPTPFIMPRELRPLSKSRCWPDDRANTLLAQSPCRHSAG